MSSLKTIMHPIHKQAIVITGASSGIGRALAVTGPEHGAWHHMRCHLAVAGSICADVLGDWTAFLDSEERKGYQDTVQRMNAFLQARQQRAEEVVDAVRQALGFSQ